MNININVKRSIIVETNKEMLSKGINTIDLNHIPFSKFTVTESNEIDFNTAMEIVAKEFALRNEMVDPISQVKLANDIKNAIKVRKIDYTITEKEVIANHKDYEVTMKHDGEFIGDIGVDAIIKLFDDSLIETIATKSELEKQSFSNKLAGELITILINVLYILSNNKTQYEINERESTKVKSRVDKKHSKNKSKSKKNKVTYIKYKDINIIKRKYVNPTEKRGSYEYHVESWVTRGHWRTYKSGKKIWINERVNNVNNSDSKTVDKTYEII